MSGPRMEATVAAAALEAAQVAAEFMGDVEPRGVGLRRGADELSRYLIDIYIQKYIHRSLIDIHVNIYVYL